MDYWFKKIDWNECVYLYQTNQSKQCFSLLQKLFIDYLIKYLYKSITNIYKNSVYEYYDFYGIGYELYINLINKYDCKKNFLSYATKYLLNHFKNEVRKIEQKDDVLNQFTLGLNLKYINEMKLDEQVNVSQTLEKIKEFFYSELNKNKSELFKKIFAYKKEGYTFKEISKKLNISYNTAKSCWEYNLKKLNKNFKNNKNVSLNN